MSLRFRNFADAERAGYHPARAGVLQHHGETGRVRLVDDSDGSARGDHYVVIGYHRATDGFGDWRVVYRSRRVTVTVWSQFDRNKLGQPGAFSVRLEPERFGRAMREAREAIDATASKGEVSCHA